MTLYWLTGNDNAVYMTTPSLELDAVHLKCVYTHGISRPFCTAQAVIITIEWCPFPALIVVY